MRKLLEIKWFVLLGLLTLACQVMAQTRTITGKVTDASDNPVPNASVVARGTKVGTSTGLDGSFTLKVPATARVLVITGVGFAPMELEIANRETIKAVLTTADKSLQDVVVVGYGTQQRNAFTGSAAKVDAAKFSTQLAPAFDKQLAGRAAGVQVTNSGGLVNTPAVIRIRGVQSLTGNNDPLIVVDGIPITTGNLAGTTNSNALGDINPADIESMDVLKDGSATAIYGSRAAGGVIVITTKKGTRGKAKVNYDGTFGWSNPLRKFSLLNAKQFETIANEKLTNAGLATQAGINTAADTSNTDWQNQVMVKNAGATNQNLSVSGASDKLAYYFSLNYSFNRGIIVSNYNRAYRVRANIDYEVNKFVRLGNSMTITRQENGDQNNGSNGLGGAIASSLRLLPNVSPFSASGYGGYNIGYPTNNLMTPGPNGKTIDDNFFNVAWSLRNDKLYGDDYRIINNTYIEVSPVKGLKLHSQAGIDMYNDYAFQGLNAFHGDGFSTNGSTFNESLNILNLIWSSYGNYTLKAGDHNFSVTGGYDVQKTTNKFFTASGSQLSDAFYSQKNVISGAATIQTIGGNFTNTGFLSSFGRFNYDFRSKYFAQASFRRDGQSALAPGRRYGTFPGFSVGWRPSQEEFWQKSGFLARWISEAKLKASYAKVGNTLTGFPYLTNFGNAAYGNVSGLGATGVGNPLLQWETSQKWDGGIDLGIYKNRFNFTADYFLNDVNNLVLAVPTPLSAGIAGSTGLSGGSISQNIGTLSNRGIELSLGGNIIQHQDFTWNLSFNYSHVANKITNLYPIGGVPTKTLTDGNYNLIRVGDPIHIIWGYRSAGVNKQNGNAMFYKADGTLVQVNLQAGSNAGVIYAANGKDDGTLGAKSSLAASDMTKLGNGVPTWYGGLYNSFTYKGIGLEFMFRYSGGNKIMNVTRQDVLFNQKFQNNGAEILNRWTHPGQVTDVPKVMYGQDANISQSNIGNSRFVEDGRFLKLQNIILSYELGQKMLKWSNGNIRSIKAFAQAQNVHTWTKYKGADPENISTAGVDNAVSPQIRSVSVGLSVGF
ncbi:TonB-dependent receptor [Puia sp.]|jgi:TonB-linked SusC/RagA family outer membrane protein|uniref:SusC/RagA family TonB-linked outer membrane protein n=1 Tax=Puia sp. TaxID=2045100 RepID=UPI002F3EBEAF